MKKKLMALMLSVSVMVGLTACGGGSGSGGDSGSAKLVERLRLSSLTVSSIQRQRILLVTTLN